MVIQIHFDNIIYQLQKVGGISTYWKEITSRVANNQKFQVHQTKGRKSTRYLPVSSSADIFHSSYYRYSLSLKTKKVITVHDFMYELGFLKTRGRKINILHTKVAIETADAIICVSENTKKDLLSIYPQVAMNPNIYVVGHGPSFKIDRTSKLQISERINKLIGSKIQKYILFIGKRLKYKNFNAALLGFSKSSLAKMGYSMICIGSKFSEVEEEFINSLGLKDKVLTLENATHNELQYLYKNAFALVYPSLYEGFGLPPLEAMSCGCPVIASNSSSIPEVVGDSGILIDPQEITCISNALKQMLDENVRNTYIAKGLDRAKLFSWDEAAKKHIQIYQALLN